METTLFQKQAGEQKGSAGSARRVPFVLIAVALCLLFAAGSAQAALDAVSGARNFANFPFWYRDLAAGGSQLQPCLGLDPDGGGLPDPLCILPTVAPLEPNYNPTLPFNFPANFPTEVFIWFAEADIAAIGTGGDHARLRLALEAAFAADIPLDGDQMTFLRVNLFLIDGLAPDSTYDVIYPYGTFQFTTDAFGTANKSSGQAFRSEDGGFPIGIVPNAFELLLPATNTNISKFLKWPSGAPVGYLGDGATPHVVTGGTNGNTFVITASAGPALTADIDPSTPGIQVSIATDLFIVAGKNFVPSISEVTPVPTPTNNDSPNYTFTVNDTGTITYGGDCTSTTTTAVLGNNTIAFAFVKNGLHTNCTITVINQAGTPSNVLTVTPFTVDAPIPVAVELAPVLSLTGDNTPAYALNSTEAGTIVSGGSCPGTIASITAGDNTIAFKALKDGLYSGCTATVVDLATNVGNTLNLAPFTIRTVRNDFDGDVRSDIGCYFPPGGNWFEFRSSEGFVSTIFGYAGTLPVTGDFDADGKGDIGAYYATGGNWYLFRSTLGFFETTFGFAGTVPVVGDFDFDGKTDIGAYFAETGSWYLFKSTEGFFEAAFGFAGTIPVVGDFDGDGRDDIGAYYPPGGNWYLFKSTEGFFETAFGFAGTIPVVGDFDGDGRDDIGVYNPPGGDWYLFKSAEGFFQAQFGFAGTEPVVGDFDGDGRDDIGVYYAPGGNWYIFKSAEGFTQTTFGFDGTIPLGGTLR